MNSVGDEQCCQVTKPGYQDVFWTEVPGYQAGLPSWVTVGLQLGYQVGLPSWATKLPSGQSCQVTKPGYQVGLQLGYQAVSAWLSLAMA